MTTLNTAPTGVENTFVAIETWEVPGDFQLRFKRGWDDALYMEVGAGWKVGTGFGRPQLGLHRWSLKGETLHQEIPGTVVCHYPISVVPRLAEMLRRSNAE